MAFFNEKISTIFNFYRTMIVPVKIKYSIIIDESFVFLLINALDYFYFPLSKLFFFTYSSSFFLILLKMISNFNISDFLWWILSLTRWVYRMCDSCTKWKAQLTSFPKISSSGTYRITLDLFIFRTVQTITKKNKAHKRKRTI